MGKPEKQLQKHGFTPKCWAPLPTLRPVCSREAEQMGDSAENGKMPLCPLHRALSSRAHTQNHSRRKLQIAVMALAAAAGAGPAKSAHSCDSPHSFCAFPAIRFGATPHARRLRAGSRPRGAFAFMIRYWRQISSSGHRTRKAETDGRGTFT
jgi:hypothetical protein